MVYARLRRVMKCEAASRHEARCTSCGARVQWVRSANQGRWLLFDADTTLARDRTIDGVTYLYLDANGLHWPRCAPAPVSAA